MLYDVIERQRLEAGIVQAIDALVARCPEPLQGYLSIPIMRRSGRSRRPLYVTVVTTSSSSWFVSAAGFYPQRDTRWLTKLEVPELRACLRFLTTGKDIGSGLSFEADLRRASSLKHQSDTMQW